MSIRIRTVDGTRVALCAAETDEMPGDIYLNDSDHYALAAKFCYDWQGQTVDWSYPEIWDAMATQVSVELSPGGGKVCEALRHPNSANGA